MKVKKEAILNIVITFSNGYQHWGNKYLENFYLKNILELNGKLWC